MKKTKKRALGDVGEEVAAKYLLNKGYSVLGRNYLKPWGELDLITKKGDRLHFVEVKTVSHGTLGRGAVRPEDNMHEYKLKRLNRAIQTYLLEHRVSQKTEWQIDLACVYLDFSTHRAKVELLENIIL